jgi:hypothetical protein
MAWIQRGVINLPFEAVTETERLLEVQRSYRHLPMDFPDACRVRMTETHERSRVFTLDSHFSQLPARRTANHSAARVAGRPTAHDPCASRCDGTESCVQWGVREAPKNAA